MPRIRKNQQRLNLANVLRARNMPYHLRPSTLAARNTYAMGHNTNQRYNRRQPHVRLPRLNMPIDRRANSVNSQSYMQEVHTAEANISNSRKRRNSMAEAMVSLQARRSAVVLHRNPRFNASGNTRSALICSKQNTTQSTVDAENIEQLQIKNMKSVAVVDVQDDDSVQVIDPTNDLSNVTHKAIRSRRTVNTMDRSKMPHDNINTEFVAKLNALQADIKEIKQLASKVQPVNTNGSTTTRTMPPPSTATLIPKSKQQMRARNRPCPTLSTILTDMDNFIKNIPHKT